MEVNKDENIVIEKIAAETQKSKMVLHQYAAFVKDSKIFFGTVTDIAELKVKIEVLEPAAENSNNLFIYPEDNANIDVDLEDVLPVIPVFSLNVTFSARVNPVWELENYDVFKSFC